MGSVLRWTRPVLESNESRTVVRLRHLWLTARPLCRPSPLTHRPFGHLLATPGHPLRAKPSNSACHRVISSPADSPLTSPSLPWPPVSCHHGDFGNLLTCHTYSPDTHDPDKHRQTPFFLLGCAISTIFSVSNQRRTQTLLNPLHTPHTSMEPGEASERSP